MLALALRFSIHLLTRFAFYTVQITTLGVPGYGFFYELNAVSSRGTLGAKVSNSILSASLCL